MTEINCQEILAQLIQHQSTSHPYENLKNSLAAANGFDTDLNQLSVDCLPITEKNSPLSTILLNRIENN
ncbi:MAG: hypothetical protein PX637_01810 [Microcystis sp. M53601_WE4]|nr:hypothetical protein [Microcystis sp. M53601_WE4]